MSTITVKELAAPTGYDLKIAAGETLDLKSQGTVTMPTGSVLQVKQATFFDTMSSTSNGTFVNITDLTVTITPQSTSSKFLLTTSINFTAAENAAPSFRFSGGNSTSYVGNARSNRRRVGFGGGDDFFNGASSAASNGGFSASMNYLDSPSTASSITYTVQCMSDANGAIYINRPIGDPDSSGEGYTSASSLIVMEVEG